MKKLLTVLFVFCCIIACDDDKKDDSSKITYPQGTKLDQKALANEDKPDGDGFTFTAPAPWTATVRETPTTRNNTVSWLRILIDGKETYAGDAGTFKITIELDANYSGVTRSASIVIQTGDDKVTLTVKQSNEKDDGTVLEIPKLITGIKVTQTKRSDYDYDPLEYQFLYDDKNFRLKEFWVNDDHGTSIFTYNYDFLDGIRITDSNENIYTAKLDDKGYVNRIQTNDGKDKHISYDSNGYILELQEDYEWAWENGNLLGTEKSWVGDDDDDYIVENPNRFSTDLNNKTNIDLNVLFYYITQYPCNTYDLYESELPLFALIDKTGPRSKNYMVWTYMDELVAVDSSPKIYTKETEPEIGEIRRVGHNFAKEKNASYTFDTDGYPVSYTQTVEVIKITTVYKGDKENITPENDRHKEWLEHEYGSGPWFYIKYQANKSQTTDVFKATISYNK